MTRQEKQELSWNILIENELDLLLEGAKDDIERENFLEEYCKKNKISIQFAKNKITRIKELKTQAEQETVGHDER